MDLHGSDDPTEARVQDCHAFADTSRRGTGSVIDLYRDAIEKVRAAELQRLHNRLPALDERSKLEVHQLADRLVAIMVEPPLDSLRDESDAASRSLLLNALQRLFRLND